MSDDFQSPFNKLPAVVVALAVVIAGIEALFQLAEMGLIGGREGIGWRIAAVEDFGVSDRVWHWMVENRVWPWDQVRRFLTYPFLHAGAYHVIFVVVFVLALGNMVARVFHPLAVLAVFFGASIAGALGFVLVLNEGRVLIGGYPGAYGLIGAFTFLLWANLGAHGANQARAFSLIAMLMAIQLGFGLFTGEFGNFVAELCGFVAGFLISFVVVPGGWKAILNKLRQR